MCAPQMPTSGNGGPRPFQAFAKAILLKSMGPNDPRRAAVSAMGMKTGSTLGAPANPAAGTAPPPTLGGR